MRNRLRKVNLRYIRGVIGFQVTRVDLETEAYKAQYGIDGDLPYEVDGMEDKDFGNKTEDFMNSNDIYK